MKKNENDDLNKQYIQYEPGFIKNNRMKCYRMLNDDIIFQEKKLQRLIKRNQMEIKDNSEKNINENKNIINNNESNLDNNNIIIKDSDIILKSNISDNNDNMYINDDISNNTEKENDLEIKSLKTNYMYGINYEKNINTDMPFYKNNNNFVYHKNHKWIAIPNSDCIVVEKYSFTNKNDNNHKEQKLLNQHKNKSYIKSLKLSLAENYLYFYTINNYIIFYKYDLQYENFLYISEHYVNHKLNINDYIIEQNEIFCFIFYDNYNLLILDYEMDNELLNIEVDFLQKYQFENIKLNKFTEHRIEFCIYSKKNFATYYLDTKILKLNESINKIGFDKTKEILCLDYLPPMSDCILLCLIVCFNDGDVFIFNLNFNNILQKYKIHYKINDIIISPFFINCISDNKLIFYKIPNLNIIKFHDINDIKLLNEKHKNEIKHDSKIISYDIDTHTTNGYALVFTENGILFIDNYQENKKIRLNSFLKEDQYIIHCIIIKNYNQNEKQNIHYYLITSHNNGLLKIYGIPSYEIVYEFETKNDEITYLIQIPQKLYFLAFYKSGFVRCFDLNKAQTTGKMKIKDIISKDRYSTIPLNFNTYIKKATFYPCGKFFIGVESYENNLILFTIDIIEPFSLESRQIPYIQINPLNDVILNNIEPYQTFLITNNNNEIFIYERKYSSLITTFDLKNDTPIYQKKDYLNNNILFSNDNLQFLLDENKMNQNICFYGFHTNHRERHYLYVFNYKSNIIILRDTKAKKTLNIIKLNESVYTLTLFNYFQDYLLYISNEKIEIGKIKTEDNYSIKKYGESYITSIKNKKSINYGNLILSDDENIVILINGNCFNVYSIEKV